MTVENFEKVADVLLKRMSPVFDRMEKKIDSLSAARSSDSANIMLLQQSVRSLGHRITHLEQTEERFEEHQIECARQRAGCPASDIKKLQWSLIGAIALLLATTGLKAAGII